MQDGHCRRLCWRNVSHVVTRQSWRRRSVSRLPNLSRVQRRTSSIPARAHGRSLRPTVHAARVRCVHVLPHTQDDAQHRHSARQHSQPRPGVSVSSEQGWQASDNCSGAPQTPHMTSLCGLRILYPSADHAIQWPVSQATGGPGQGVFPAPVERCAEGRQVRQRRNNRDDAFSSGSSLLLQCPRLDPRALALGRGACWAALWGLALPSWPCTRCPHHWLGERQVLLGCARSAGGAPSACGVSYKADIALCRTPSMTACSPAPEMRIKHTDTGHPLPDFFLQNTCNFAATSVLAPVACRQAAPMLPPRHALPEPEVA
jgi:hypothetical protein